MRVANKCEYRRSASREGVYEEKNESREGVLVEKEREEKECE